MIRAVLDCNVLISAFPNPGGVPSKIIDIWTNLDFELVISEPMLTAVDDAWRKPYFRRRFTRQQASASIALLRQRSSIGTPPPSVRGVADDDEDDYVLSTAVAGSATHLVTGDRGLLRLGTYQGITILPPREFLELLTTPVTTTPST